MTDDRVEYCPWCGGDVSYTVETQGHTAFKAKQCDECDTVFKVQVPHRETNVKWTDTQ